MECDMVSGAAAGSRGPAAYYELHSTRGTILVQKVLSCGGMGEVRVQCWVREAESSMLCCLSEALVESSSIPQRDGVLILFGWDTVSLGTGYSVRYSKRP